MSMSCGKKTRIMQVTLTTCLRPTVLDYSLKSFVDNLVNINFKKLELLINIDMLPLNECSYKTILKITKKYFKKIRYNVAKEPNFAKAVKWVWSNATSDIIFHLEDDWKLKQKIDFNHLLKILKDNKKLYQLRLTKNLEYTGMHTYGLSPCLIKKEFYSIVAKNLEDNINPEKQLRNVNRWGLLPNYEETVKAFPLDKIIIKDIGREWRVTKHMSKPKYETDFLNWEYKDKIIR